MYITCEQCSTIYRLDENLLKPTGSKVRCSQCRHVFMASPPQTDAAVAVEPGVAAAVAGAAEQQTTFDQELEGIDLAELDSILEDGNAMAGGDALADLPEEAGADELVEFNEADLDFDFESALEGDIDDVPAEAAAPEPPAEVPDEEPAEVSDELDLDMDFELDDSLEDAVEAMADAPSAAADDDIDLDMEFELDEEPEESDEALPADDDIVLEESELSEDVELALDEFADALGQAEGDDESLPAADAAVSDADAKDAGAAAEDVSAEIDLGDLDAILDADDEDAPVEEEVDEDLELSLADSDVVDSDSDADAAAVAVEPAAVSEMDEAVDDLDLTGGLEDLLDDIEPDVEADEPEDVELSLDDDLTLELSDASDKGGEADAVESVPSLDQGDDDLDLGGLDDLLEDEEETVEAAMEDEELSLDEDLDLELSDDTVSEEDDISLVEELDLDIEEEPALEAEPSAEMPAPEAARDEFDLSDFESLLGEDEEGGDIELTDLDGLLDEADSPVEEAEEATELSMDDDLELSLDDDLSLDVDDEAPTAAVETPSDEDDLDLSMLETDMLDDEAGEERQVPDEDMELSLDDDMELVLDDEPEAQAEPEGASDEDLGDIEDLDFELDAEFEDKPVFQASGDADDEAPTIEKLEDTADEELDLTDIEKMLEDDAIVPDVADASEGVDLDIESDGAEKWADDLDGDLGLGGADEIDLTEIEDAIDAADQDKGDLSLADGEDDFDLDLDLEPEPQKAAEEPEPLELELEMEEKAPAEATDEGSEEELDLSDINLSIEESQPSVETETIDGGDIQLEFQVDTADPDEMQFGGEETIDAAKTTAARAETTEFPLDDETFSGDDTITTELVKEVTAAEAPSPAFKKKKKGGASKFLIFLLVLAALGGGGYYGYDYVVKNNIHIPYLSDYINPEAKDPSGVMQLSTTDINGKFIENEVAGRLFAVTGKVRNGYGVPRKLIRLRGKLYVKENPQPKTIEQAFAGLVIADQELSSKTLAEIKKQLSATKGQDAAITVGPGKTIPFMVVFSDLPADLDQYDIELVSSIKAQ